MLRVRAPRIAALVESTRTSTQPALELSSLIISGGKTAEGLIIAGTTAIFSRVLKLATDDPNFIYEIPPYKMEELVAACLKEEGFDTVTLTPRSRDGGVDVIAVKNGFGSLKLLGSVKAYKPGHIVSYDAIRALLGVVSGDPAASKGMITTTSSFPPSVMEDKVIAQAVPTRLELVDGKKLVQWIAELQAKQRSR